jgi:hypothetical protein
MNSFTLKRTCSTRTNGDLLLIFGGRCSLHYCEKREFDSLISEAHFADRRLIEDQAVKRHLNLSDTSSYNRHKRVLETITTTFRLCRIMEITTSMANLHRSWSRILSFFSPQTLELESALANTHLAVAGHYNSASL